ncbi:hypothetical protein [Providencia sp. PROV273]|uniref:hypothetical protein n=1 Tax=Providencia sp. PROV273 TaxID=2949960 RepID=UPI002349AF82|nr:hypothetical protein [Providencia sp. PROV273]
MPTSFPLESLTISVWPPIFSQKTEAGLAMAKTVIGVQDMSASANIVFFNIDPLSFFVVSLMFDWFFSKKFRPISSLMPQCGTNQNGAKRQRQLVFAFLHDQ